MSEGAEPESPRPPGPKLGWRDRDHTRGSLTTSLFVLSLPLLVGSLAGGVVFQLIDLAFVSRLGEAPMAAVIIVNQSVRQMLFLLLMGGSFGAQALIARSVGEGDVEGAEHIAGQVVLLGGVFAGAVAIAGGLFPEALFSIPGPDPSFYPYGVPYLRLVFLTFAGFTGNMLFAAILGGAGDTTTPLFVILIQTGVAIVAEWVLIFGQLGAPALGVSGVAYGVACGNFVGLGLGLTVLFRGTSRVHLRRRHLVPDLRVIRRIVALSWPPAIQMGTSVVMIFAFLRLAGGFGESVQAAYAIGLRLSMIGPAVSFPLASACATIVGQALGSGNPGRAWRAVGAGLVVHGAIMWSFAALVFAFRTPIMALFSDDPEVIRFGAEYLRYASGAFFMWAFYFVFLRALQGAGDVLVPMAISLTGTFLVTLPLAYTLTGSAGLGPSGIWIAFVVASIFNTLGTGSWLATGRWTRRARFSGPREA